MESHNLHTANDSLLHSSFGGLAGDMCSDHDFLTRMPGAEECHGFPRQKTGSSIIEQLRVFWYPKTHKSDRASSPGTSSVFTSRILAASSSGSGRSSKAQWSIEDKIKYLLLSLKCYYDDDDDDDAVLVQFWAPIVRDNNQIALSVSHQPFGLTKLLNGLVEYRRSCIQLENSVESISQLGPLGRVFTRGSQEQICDIDKFYSTETFPLKNIAINCDIHSYRALPLFEPDCHSQRCVGVIEIVSTREYGVLNVCSGAENKDFMYGRPHCEVCKKLIFPQFDAVQPLLGDKRDGYIRRVWVPCICDSSSPWAFSEFQDNHYISSNSPTRITHLFHQSPSFYWGKNDGFKFNGDDFRVDNDESWVGRAYILDKLCFLTDSTDCFTFDHTISFESDCRIAIPFKLIHPKLPPLLLEVFIVYLSKEDEEAWKQPEAQLKSLLLELARNISEYDHVEYGLKQNEEFCVEYSSLADDGNSIFFDVHRRDVNMNNGETMGNGRPLQFQPPHGSGSPNLINNVQQLPQQAAGQKKCSVLIENSNPQDTGESSNEFSANADAEIISQAVENGQLPVADEYFEGERGQPTPPLLIQQPTVEEAGVHPTTTLNGVKIDITLDMIKQYFGRDLADAAELLGVSRSTVKRRLRDFGIERWPSHKRNKANGVRPVSKSLEVGGEVIQESEIECCPNNGETERRRAEATDSIPTTAKGKNTEQEFHENDLSYTMTVKATYNGEIAKFKFLSDLGIEKLRGELDKRFKLEEFRFKYEDEDGEWITIFCDEDLQLYMESLKATGNRVMRLSVFIVT